MKYYRGKRKQLIITFMAVILWVMPADVCHAEEQSDTYYLIFHNDEDNDIYIELGEAQVLFTNYSESIDLTNLEFLPQTTRIHYEFSSKDAELESLTAEMREHLLHEGYAKLINEDIATEGEKSNQQYAKTMKLRIWESTLADDIGGESGKNAGNWDITEITDVVSEKWYDLCSWAKAEKELIISLMGCGIFAFLGRAIYRALRTKKKIIFFGGANRSGKTTLAKLLINPDASRKDLLGQGATLSIDKNRIIRDDENRRLTLKACLLDTPGHELQCAIDELALTLYTRIFRKRYIVIIMAAPTKSNENRNEIDYDYIKDQYNTIDKLWFAILKSKRIIKPQSVVLFINKIDLYDDVETAVSALSAHSKLLEKICNESKIPFKAISGSVLDKAGMTDLMQILRK